MNTDPKPAPAPPSAGVLPRWLALVLLGAALALSWFGFYLVWSEPTGEQWFIPEPPPVAVESSAPLTGDNP